MGNGFQFVDIIFFAMVAAFLVLRLRGILGRRTGEEKPPADLFPKKPGPAEAEGAKKDDVVVRLPNRPKTGPGATIADILESKIEPAQEFKGPPGIKDVMAADSSFQPQGFLSGARAAFEIIVGAFAAGDEKTLKNLLSDEVYGPFGEAIKARKEAGETLQTEIIAVKSAEIEEARMEDRNALVTVRFVTEQVNVVRDKENRIVDGDPNRIAQVVDIWTFRRDTRSRDPNWILVETKVPE